MPDLSLDEELRAVVFAHIQRLRARYDGRIPKAELNVGVQFRGARVPIWNPGKGIHKPAALGKDGAALAVQTSVESPYEDTHDAEAGHFIYKYQGVDPTNGDNVALRRAMEWQRPILYLVGVDPQIFDAIFPVYLVADDPLRLQFTMMADQPSISADASSQMVELRRAYATRAVLYRLHQQEFRRVVLRAYSERCAICRLKHRDLLDAAHILADGHPMGAPVVTNGLGLCKIHHSAFDANIIGIDTNAQVHVRSDILIEEDGPMLKHGLQEVHGSKLLLPRNLASQPNREFLAERFREFRAA